MLTSLRGRIKRTSPFHEVVPEARLTKGGIHSSCIACGTTKPPPWDIEEIRDIDREVRDVPRTRWEAPIEYAVYNNSNLVKVDRVDRVAVGVGKARRWAFKASIGSESDKNVNDMGTSFEELTGRTLAAQINGYFCRTRSRIARNSFPPTPIEGVLHSHRNELASLVASDSFANLRSSVVRLVQV
jgi:hypothetical protein